MKSGICWDGSRLEFYLGWVFGGTFFCGGGRIQLGLNLNYFGIFWGVTLGVGSVGVRLDWVPEQPRFFLPLLFI